jgi:hypothetical protein
MQLSQSKPLEIIIIGGKFGDLYFTYPTPYCAKDHTLILGEKKRRYLIVYFTVETQLKTIIIHKIV